MKALRDKARALARSHFDRWEGVVEDVMLKFFDRQQAVVVARLTGKQARRGTRHWRPEGMKAIDPRRVFDQSKWNRELRNAMEPVFERMIADVGRKVFEDLRAEGVFNVRNPNVSEAIDRRVTKIVGINKTTEDAIRQAIKAGEAAGESIDDITARVRHVFDTASTARARRIARTETIGASNEGAVIAARESGVAARKTWLATGDARTRPEHLDADGQEADLDGFFTVGGEDLEFPGDPGGSAENVVNCRCTVIFE